MPELILSDITVMGQGYCVIGLEKLPTEKFRSVRPMPPLGFAWRDPFKFKRGDCVNVHWKNVALARPHIEDCPSAGLAGPARVLSEGELIACLKKAETAQNLETLFDCAIQRSTQGGRAVWVNPEEARRSICGCEYENLRIRLFPEPPNFNLRAEILLTSNERLSSIPVVDREWREFARRVVCRIQRADPLPLAERFLNRLVSYKILLTPERFVRIGLPRPRADQHCWLMLDSLFPQPQASWLDGI